MRRAIFISYVEPAELSICHSKTPNFSIYIMLLSSGVCAAHVFVNLCKMNSDFSQFVPLTENRSLRNVYHSHSFSFLFFAHNTDSIDPALRFVYFPFHFISFFAFTRNPKRKKKLKMSNEIHLKKKCRQRATQRMETSRIYSVGVTRTSEASDEYLKLNRERERWFPKSCYSPNSPIHNMINPIHGNL